MTRPSHLYLLTFLMLVVFLISACGDSNKQENADSSTPRRTAALPTQRPTRTPIGGLTPPPTFAGSSDTPAGAVYTDKTIQEGSINFGIFCVSCHGADARGLVGYGPSLLDNEFIVSRSDAELLAFVIEGRASYDPENTSGVTMPARAGFPNLGDEQILSIVAYIRSLQQGNE